MKKTLFLMLMAILAVGKLSAQNILGEWATTMNEDGQDITLSYGFNKDNTSFIRMTVEAKDPEMGVISFCLNVPGTYKLSGNKLTVNSDKKKAELKLTKLQLTGEMGEAAKDPGTEKMIRSMIESQLGSQKEDLLKDIPMNTTYTIVSQTSDKLVLADADAPDDPMEFTKVK